MNPDNIFTNIAAGLVNLFTTNAALFEAAGLNIFRVLVIFVFIMFFIDTMVNGFDGRRAIRMLAMVLIVSSILHFYSRPFWFTDVSFHTLFTDAAQYWANILEGGQDQALQMRLNEFTANMEMPTITRWMALGYFYTIVIIIGIVRFAMVAVTGVGFLGLGIGTLLGPIYIPFAIFPNLEYVAWNWFKAWTSYALYMVVGAAVINILSFALIRWFDSAFNGPTSLADLQTKFSYLFSVLLMCAYGVFKVPSMTASYAAGRVGEATLSL